MLKPDEISAATKSAELVVEVHRRLADWLAVGQTLAQIDHFIAEALENLKAKSAFLGYRTGRHPRFPSHACLSLNDVIVHGTAGMTGKPMEVGDVLSVDIGVKFRGWIGDAAWTYVFQRAGEATEKRCRCGREALKRGIAALQPGRPLIDWARIVQGYVEDECGMHCVRGLGGHGYGQALHKPPFIANSVPLAANEWPDAHHVIRKGLLVAVEPMVAVGTSDIRQEHRKWPIRTRDGSLAVHFEHDVLVTADGPQVLTRDLETLPLVVG